MGKFKQLIVVTIVYLEGRDFTIQILKILYSIGFLSGHWPKLVFPRQNLLFYVEVNASFFLC